SVYIACNTFYSNAVRRVDGTGLITTVAGSLGVSGGYFEGSLATSGGFQPASAVRVAPTGELFALTTDGHIARIGRALDLASGTNMLVAGFDGNVYKFNNTAPTQTTNIAGRVEGILTPYRGRTLYTMAYDSIGRLTSITDLIGRVTTIDYSSNPITIKAPLGDSTALTKLTLTNGYLSQL